MGECRSCKARVHWALTPNGAKAPIDYEPVENGNVLLLRPRAFGYVTDNALGELLAVTLSGDALALARRHTPGLLFVNHWATCPDKADWRKKTDEAREVERTAERREYVEAAGSRRRAAAFCGMAMGIQLAVACLRESGHLAEADS